MCEVGLFPLQATASMHHMHVVCTLTAESTEDAASLGHKRGPRRRPPAAQTLFTEARYTQKQLAIVHWASHLHVQCYVTDTSRKKNDKHDKERQRHRQQQDRGKDKVKKQRVSDRNAESFKYQTGRRHTPKAELKAKERRWVKKNIRKHDSRRQGKILYSVRH